jgi:hypothetical protein
MDFDDDDLSNEDFEAEERKWKNHPLYLKAEEIMQTVDVILDTLEDEDEREMLGSTLKESAMIIPAKLAGALGSDNYLVCMQNASIIRFHAEYLRLSNHSLKEFTKADKKYIKAFRTEIEEFREMFKAWVKTFNDIPKEEDDFEDEWGLFLRN